MTGIHAIDFGCGGKWLTLLAGLGFAAAWLARVGATASGAITLMTIAEKDASRVIEGYPFRSMRDSWLVPHHLRVRSLPSGGG